jgi:diacylglycerol kinase (ATP)
LRIAIIHGPRPKPDRIRLFQEAVDAEWATDLVPGLDAVLIFGGDGTIHRHLARLHELQVPMLIVPTGSGNDFASSLGIHNPKDALKHWQRFVAKKDNVRTIDLGRVRDSRGAHHLFCNVANVGLDSEINRRANALPPFLRANGGYVLSLFPALFQYSAPMVRVVADGQTIARPMTLVAAANGTRYGRGFHIAPRANMADGFLDLCFVREASRLKIAGLFPLVYFGQHLGLKEVNYFKFRRLEIETPRPMDIYADGEFLCRTPAEISVVPAGLRVISP